MLACSVRAWLLQCLTMQRTGCTACSPTKLCSAQLTAGLDIQISMRSRGMVHMHAAEQLESLSCQRKQWHSQC